MAKEKLWAAFAARDRAAVSMRLGEKKPRRSAAFSDKSQQFP
jgi:hypothetical protein